MEENLFINRELSWMEFNRRVLEEAVDDRWMPRNLDPRVEVAFPLLESALRDEIDEVLTLQLSDNAKAWRILADGTSERIPRNGVELVRSQEQIYSVLSPPYSSFRAVDD